MRELSLSEINVISGGAVDDEDGCWDDDYECFFGDGPDDFNYWYNDLGDVEEYYA